MSNEMREALEVARDFLSGQGGPWDWGEFINLPVRDPAASRFQDFCRSLPVTFPPINPIEYCSDDGKAALRRYIDELTEKDTEVL